MLHLKENIKFFFKCNVVLVYKFTCKNFIENKNCTVHLKSVLYSLLNSKNFLHNDPSIVAHYDLANSAPNLPIYKTFVLLIEIVEYILTLKIGLVFN